MNHAAGGTLPRVLHALTPAPVGGLESVVAMLAREWVGRGGGTAIAMALDPGAPVPAGLSALATAGVELFPFWTMPRAYWQERKDYRRIFRDWRPALVHTHGYRADLLAGAAAGDLRLPRVSTFHGFTGGGWKNRLYEYLQIRAARRCDAVIAVSAPIQGRLVRSGVLPARVHLVPNALARREALLDRAAARAELGLAPEATVIGWIGRLSLEKGPDVLLRAVPDLGDPGWQVSMIGEGPLRSLLRQTSDQLGIAERVRWHGLVPDAARCYAAFDCVVLSSRTEGTPIVLLEAMAGGIPVVATRVGGVPDVMREDEGFLVPPEAPAALAAAVRSVLTDRGAAASRAARAAARIARDYAPGPWLDRHAELYRSILATGRGQTA
jgi:glycosyltransferase involved in cell wall biosynthesis